MPLSNDERGWVMTCLSGIACVLGASIICVDIFVHMLPGNIHFKIEESNTFLSASLSLSFGVMLFSALYKMLPSSKSALMDGGMSPKFAAWMLISCFLVGAIGIQILSRFLHKFMPSHTVDCEHTHDDEGGKQDSHPQESEHLHEPRPETPRQRDQLPGHTASYRSARRTGRQSSHFVDVPGKIVTPRAESDTHGSVLAQEQLVPDSQRPSLRLRMSQTFSRMRTSKKATCDGDGPCYGYSDPCSNECFKNVASRGGSRATSHTLLRPGMLRTATAPQKVPPLETESTPLLQRVITKEHVQPFAPMSRSLSSHVDDTHLSPDADDSDRIDGAIHPDPPAMNGSSHDLRKTQSQQSLQSHASAGSSPVEHHHHHVPTNAFLSIGLQTSIAIALHKLPEGFITYATNHANPRLGFSVFLALFIHNITEGFAMALPLYLAIGSRTKAMLWSFVLGGLSQPLGAAVAAVWFKLAGDGDWAPSEAVYGGMFAVTAGIMASVALQLFSESLVLTHSKNICMVGAFTGMGIIGVSSALTA